MIIFFFSNKGKGTYERLIINFYMYLFLYVHMYNIYLTLQYEYIREKVYNRRRAKIMLSVDNVHMYICN